MRIVYSPQLDARWPKMIPHTGPEVRIDLHGIDAFSWEIGIALYIMGSSRLSLCLD